VAGKLSNSVQKSGRTWGRLLMFVAPIGLWRVTCDAAQSARDTLIRSTATVRAIGARRERTPMDWNTAIAVLRVSQARIEREVLRRQVMAFVAVLFIFAGIYGAWVWGAHLPGIGCACLAGVYYLQASLRLHQIRNREFISLARFIARVKRQPAELLPLGLPGGWTLYGPSSR